MLLFEGLFDVYTPPKATEATAGAAKIPILAPIAQQSLVQELLQIDGVEAPTSANINAWDGKRVTGGLSFPTMAISLYLMTSTPRNSTETSCHLRFMMSRPSRLERTDAIAVGSHGRNCSRGSM